MVFPWQKIMQSEQNPYTTIKNRGSLIVGTINNPIYYFIGNEGESGLEYELAKNFADYLGVRLQIKTLENNDQLFNELENNNIDIAVLTIPKEKAIEVANMLVDNGVRAIWNFAHTDLNLPDNIVVENVHLSESLMQLSYNISRYKEDHK